MASVKSRALVSIINWNNSAATNACLASIAKIPLEKQPDIILSDNDSRKEKLKVDKNTANKIRSLDTIHNKENLGFAGGHNLIIKRAQQEGYDYIILLNNDTELVDAQLFDKLISALEADKSAIAAAPTIIASKKPEIVWYAGGDMRKDRLSAKHRSVGIDYSNLELEDEPQKVTFLTGCTLAIKLDKNIKVDRSLNEEYFLYWEDADWCARMLAENLNLLYVSNAKVLHHTSTSLGVRSPSYAYYNLRNNIIFTRNWGTFIGKLVVVPLVAWISFKYVVIAVRLKSNAINVAKACIYAILDGMRSKTGPLTRKLQ